MILDLFPCHNEINPFGWLKTFQVNVLWMGINMGFLLNLIFPLQFCTLKPQCSGTPYKMSKVFPEIWRIRESRLQILADRYSLILLKWRMEFPIGYLYHPCSKVFYQKWEILAGKKPFWSEIHAEGQFKLGRTSFIAHSGLN